MKGLILGKGLSGKSAKELLSKLSVEAEVWDDSDPPPDLVGYDFAVKSPGFSWEHPLIKELKRLKVPTYGEVELAYRFSEGDLISVTGTNGKSTTTALIHHVLKTCGLKTFIGGNYGIPFSDFALETTKDSVSVLELSSFQIEDLLSFKSKVSVILNVTPDHLNRYPSFNEYLKAKLRLARFSELLVINGDDPNLSSLKGKPGVYAFSLKEKADAYFDGERLICGPYSFRVKELPLEGYHNLENYLACLLTIKFYNLEPEKVRTALRTFTGLPHRCQKVAEVNGVLFINDSKSTNTDSLKRAVESFEGAVVIAGGSDKGLPFEELLPVLPKKAKALVVIGETAPKLDRLFKDKMTVKRAETLKEAVRTAFNLAKPKGTVLFSPGCASFDMFKNYAHRGERFVEEVLALKEELQ